MNGQSHLRAPSKCFLTFVPWQPLNLKPGGSSLTDIREHLLKRAWEGMIPAWPTVEANIIDVRLNSITLKTCFLPTEKKNQSTLFKIISIQNVSHAELAHAFEITMPRSFGILSYLWDFLIIWKKICLIIKHYSLHMHPWRQSILGEKDLFFPQCWETNPWICTC